MNNIDNQNNKYAYENENGVNVYGSAAHNHYVHTIMGGIGNYEKQIVKDAFDEFLNSTQFENMNNQCIDKETNITQGKDLWD